MKRFAPAPPAVPDSASMEKARILVVEDEAIIARDIRQQLIELGYDPVGHATRGEEAVALAGQLRPDLVLMDITLAGSMDGIVAAHAIRDQFALPVVFLTAFAEEKTLERAKLSEPFGYVVKPFSERELRTTLSIALYKHRTETRLRVSEERLAVTLNSIGDAVLATDARRRITLMNPVAEALTGWSQAEALGRPVGDVFRIIDEETRAPAELPSDEALAEGKIRGPAKHTVLLARGGGELEIGETAAPIRDLAGRITGMVLCFRDESAKRRAERAERRRARQTAFFQDTLLALRDHEGRELAEFLRLATAGVAHALEVERVSVWLFHREGAVLRCEDRFRRSTLNHEGGQELTGSKFPRYFASLDETPALVIESLADDPRIVEFGRDNPELRGIGSLLDVPIRSGEETFGLLGCAHEGAPRAWTEEEVKFAVAAASYLMVAVAQSKRRQVETALKLSEFSVQHASAATFWVGRDARILRVNLAASALLGYAEAELLARKITQLDPNFPAERWPAHWAEIRERKRMQFETLLTHRAGHLVPVELELNAFEFEGREFIFAFVRDITARRLGERELREREQLLSSINANLAGTCVYRMVYPPDGRMLCTYVSPNVEDLIGVPTAELLKDPAKVFGLMQADDLAEFRRELGAVLRTGDNAAIAVRMRSAAGAVKWFQFRSRLVERRADGTQVRDGVVVDITAVKAAEQELREFNANLERLVAARTAELGKSEALFRNLVESINHGYYVADRRSLFTYCNPSIVAVYGIRAEQLRGTSVFRMVLDEDRARVVAAYRQWVREGIQDATIEFRVKTATDRVIWVEQTTAIMRAEDGALREFRSSLRDVTERKAAEAQLRQSNERFRAVFERSPIIIGLLTVPEGRLVEFNAAGVAAFGHAREEAVGRTSTELGLWADLGERDRYLAALRAKGFVNNFEARMRRKNGEVFSVLYSGSLIQIDGQTYSLNSLLDISAQRESEQRLAHALEATDDGVWDWNIPTGDVYFSPQWQRLLGYEPGEVALRVESFFPLIHPEDVEAVRAAIDDHLHGRTAVKQSEVRLRTKSGDYRWFLDRGKVVAHDAAGAPLRMVGTITDITERKRAASEQVQMQARVFQNQKYEALGTLAGGVAHDFNNILTGMINFSVLARDDCPPSHPNIREFIGEVLKSGERARLLVRQILLFSRSEEAERGPAKLQPVVKEVLSLLRSTLPASIEIKSEIDADTPVVLANATQIHQVVMNLGINAAQAMPPRGGCLTVRLGRRVLDSAAAVAWPELLPGLFASLEVSDDGSGIEPEVLRRIFEPFFTTKGVGEGTGLGLAVVQSVVRTHGGAITVRSRPGNGTTFEVLIPAMEREEPTAAPLVSSAPRGQGQRILLVDDEPSVAKSMQLMLERLGYRVTTSGDSNQALGFFQIAPKAFEAVITDFQMPGKTGVDLARQLRAMNPTLPIFVTSGYAGKTTQAMMREAGVTEFIPKPVNIEDVARLLAGIAKPPR